MSSRGLAHLNLFCGDEASLNRSWYRVKGLSAVNIQPTLDGKCGCLCIGGDVARIEGREVGHRITVANQGVFGGETMAGTLKEIHLHNNGIEFTPSDRENLLNIAKTNTTPGRVGLFGVGFYSAFLVADKVTVVTKSSDGEQLRWESEAASSYTISPDDSEPLEGSGTRLILHLKEDADKYVDDYTLRDMLKRVRDGLEPKSDLEDARAALLDGRVALARWALRVARGAGAIIHILALGLCGWREVLVASYSPRYTTLLKVV